MASEKVIISFPIELESSAHQGGSLAWDKNGNLFIATGDNTVPFESNGHSPIDERPGRITFDAQRSASNPNDLRGKILRIHPEQDGSYTIPEGNLFAVGTPGTLPEIYTMGLRNPYRIAVDKATSFLYWGEVGPDGGHDGKQGPRGYDEVNQAKKAGNFGWPYFIGNTKPYYDYDFGTESVGALFARNVPINNSPNNTGLKNLPPAQDAMIWYPYSKSDEFPELGLGGRCVVAGDYYHFDPKVKSENKIPQEYDNALFIMDWMRNWVFAVRFDENNNFKRLDPFMPNVGDFRRPIDLEFGADGAMYMLEYGSVYGIDNDDARLVKIEYNKGNRAPVARISVNDSLGTAPFTAYFGSGNTYDFDEDEQLNYEWYFDGKTLGSKESWGPYTYKENGIYKAVLKITDRAGLSSTDTLEIRVGNTLPEITINVLGNKTFYSSTERSLKYSVDVKDKEDQVIDKNKVKVTVKYLPKVGSANITTGHQVLSDFNLGKSLVAGSDCKACHQMDKRSVGPSFMEISKKYIGDKSEIGRLSNKILTGGGGVWGEHAMNAHPQLSLDETTEIVKYIYSLSEQKKDNFLPAAGTITLKDHIGKSPEGRYVITASYTDKGGAISELTGTKTHLLRPATVLAETADFVYEAAKNPNNLYVTAKRSFFQFTNLDLTGVKSLRYKYFSKLGGVRIEVHKDSPNGELLSSLDLKSTGQTWENYQQITSPIKATEGIHSLYFVISTEKELTDHLLTIEDITFE